MAPSVADAAGAYYRESVEFGDAAWDTWLERADRDRSDVARIIGADASRLAFLSSASLGFNICARSLEPGRPILALDQEFPSCTTPFLTAGHDVRFLPTHPDGSPRSGAWKKALESGPQALVLSSVQFANGYRSDLSALASRCRELGLKFIVDATQSVCAFPLDVKAMGIDALVFSGYKWATAGYGTAVLATGPGWPDQVPLVGWRSAKDAYALENDRLDLLPGGLAHEMGHPPFPSIFAMAAALRLWESFGIDTASSRIRTLAELVRTGAQERGWSVRSHKETAHQSGIVLIDLPNASQVCAGLKARSVWTTARDGGLRVSMHAYNNEEDIEAFFNAADDLLAP